MSSPSMTSPAIFDARGKEAVSSQAIANVLRRIYPSVEQAYLELNRVDAAPVCACGSPVKFIVQTVSVEQREAQSRLLKKKIIDGDFVPARNHWNWKNSRKEYRSRWEWAYHLANPHLEYETIRVPYTSNSGKRRTYIIDFFDKEKGICFEVKPSGLIESANVKVKTLAALEMCRANGWYFHFVTEQDILEALQISGTNEPQLCKLKTELQRDAARKQRSVESVVSATNLSLI